MAERLYSPRCDANFLIICRFLLWLTLFGTEQFYTELFECQCNSKRFRKKFIFVNHSARS